MNRKGSVLTAVISIFAIFMFGVLMIPFLKDNITQGRSDLNCSNPSAITGGNQMTCLILDGVLPYFLWAIFSIIAGGILHEL